MSATCFIQWKGTKVCMDLYCACGEGGHLDADFAYYVRCPACGQVYELGTAVSLTPITEVPDGSESLVQEAS